MKELIIHVKIIDDKTATAVQKRGFDNSSSSQFEILGILQNILRVEQDKMFKNSTTISTDDKKENGKSKV